MSLLLQNVDIRRGDGFSLQVPHWSVQSGQLEAVLGTNGAGKSSFFAAITGELPCRGQIALHGRALADWPGRERARHLGVLPQHSQLSFGFTAEEVVALGLTPLSLSWREGQRRIRKVMERTDCAHLAGRAFPGLSGGERQRVSLARVLLQLSEAEWAPVLLLDEPTSAQDLGHQHALLRLARELAGEGGWAVVAILHDLNHALRYADHCTLLDRGRVLGRGLPEGLLSEERVAAVWGYAARRVEGAGNVVMV